MRFEGSLAAIFERLCAVEKSMQQEMVERKEKKIQQTLFSAAAGPNVSVAGTQRPKLCVIPKTPNTLSASPSPPRLILLSVSSFGQKGFFFFFFLSEVVLSRKASKHRHLFTGRGSLQHFTCPFQFTTCLTSAE